MSSTKIIKGWVQCNADRFFGPAHDDNSIVLYEGCNELDKRMNKRQPATLYIGTGKVWTEDEVRAMFNTARMVARIAAKATTKPDNWQEIVETDFSRIAAEHGLTL